MLMGNASHKVMLKIIYVLLYSNNFLIGKNLNLIQHHGSVRQECMKAERKWRKDKLEVSSNYEAMLF